MLSTGFALGLFALLRTGGVTIPVDLPRCLPEAPIIASPGGDCRGRPQQGSAVLAQLEERAGNGVQRGTGPRSPRASRDVPSPSRVHQNGKPVSAVNASRDDESGTEGRVSRLIRQGNMLGRSICSSCN